MDIARAIRESAAKRNMTQADICRKTDISDSYMSLLFNGKIADPKASTVYRISHALEMSVDELINLACSYE